MAGRGKSYREKRRKTVTAPSGFEFTIRKPGAKAITNLFKAFGEPTGLPDDIEQVITDEDVLETAKEVLSDRSPDEIMASMDELIIDCVTAPKIVEYETDNDDELCVNDIEMPDYFFLCNEIAMFAGVTKEKLQELFRDLGGLGGSTGGTDIGRGKPKT